MYLQGRRLFRNHVQSQELCLIALEEDKATFIKKLKLKLTEVKLGLVRSNSGWVISDA